MVVARIVPRQESNLRPLDHESSALTTTYTTEPPSNVAIVAKIKLLKDLDNPLMNWLYFGVLRLKAQGNEEICHYKAYNCSVLEFFRACP